MTDFITLSNILKASTKLSDLPSKISLNDSFWTQIKNIRKYTDSGSKNFKDSHTGSTGWEYEMIMAYVYNDYFYSDIHTSKDYEKVHNNHKLEVKPEQEKDKILDKIYIDSKLEGEISWELSELPSRKLAIENGKYPVDFIAHFHSHPISIYNQKKIYTFYSGIDIESLFEGGTNISGLICDRLFLLCKLSSSTKPTQEDLQSITSAEYHNPENLLNVASEVCKKHNLGLYVSDEFRGDLSLM